MNNKLKCNFSSLLYNLLRDIVKTYIPKSTVLLLALSLNSCANRKPVLSANDFKKIAADSIKSQFKSDNFTGFALMEGVESDIYLYSHINPNIDNRNSSPVSTIKCKNKASFNIIAENENKSGITSMGIIKISYCDNLSKEEYTTIINHNKSYDFFKDIFTKGGTRLDYNKLMQYKTKPLNSNLLLQTFTFVMIGHGAMFAPTAIITSKITGETVLIQFESIPNCKDIKTKNINFCSNIEKSYELIALYILNH